MTGGGKVGKPITYFVRGDFHGDDDNDGDGDGDDDDAFTHDFTHNSN